MRCDAPGFGSSQGEVCARTTPNQALEPTPDSLRFYVAAAIGRGSPPALGCAETNRHDVKECTSPTVKVEPTTLAPRQARAAVPGSVKRCQGKVPAGYGAPHGPRWVPTRAAHAAGTSGPATLARRPRPWRGRRPLAGRATAWTGLGRPCVGPCPSPHGPHGAPHGHARDARTQGGGPCQRPRAAPAHRAPGARQHQQAQATTAEDVEGRARATGPAGPHPRGRTPGRAALARARDRVRQAARERASRVTARWPPGSASDRRREASTRRTHEAAAGVDGPPWAPSGAQRDPTRRDVSERLQRGAEQAPPVARVARPPAAGRQRPRGTPTRDDPSVPRATGEGRTAIAAHAWRGCASGARPGRRPPPAVEAVTVGRAQRPLPWGRDAARRGLYEARDHAWLGPCVAPRRGDPRVVRPRRPWRTAGVLEAGHGRPQAEGTPHGGRARPVLAQRSRPAGVDRWAAQGRRRHARGDVMRGRYGAACRVGFQPTAAAEPCVRALRERCHRGPRARHPDTPRRRAGGRWARARRQRRGPGHPATVDVLGLTPRCGPTTRGQWTVRRGPIAPRLRTQRQEVTPTLRARLHGPREPRGAGLTRGVGGHSRSSGVPRTRGRRWVVRKRRRRYGCRPRRRRRQRQRLPWQRMDRRATHGLPAPHSRQPSPAQRLRVTTHGRRPVRSCRTPGAGRGVLGNWHPYRDRLAHIGSDSYVGRFWWKHLSGISYIFVAMDSSYKR